MIFQIAVVIHILIDGFIKGILVPKLKTVLKLFQKIIKSAIEFTGPWNLMENPAVGSQKETSIMRAHTIEYDHIV